MRKRVGEIEEFAFGYLTPNPDGSDEGDDPDEGLSSIHNTISKDATAKIITQQLHITIAISGWLSDDQHDNFTRPWRSLFSSREQYYLRYESAYLLELGRAMDLILSFAVSMAAQEALKYTILAGWYAVLLHKLFKPFITSLFCSSFSQTFIVLLDALIHRKSIVLISV